jgi:PAS domain S-box-containing protein
MAVAVVAMAALSVRLVMANRHARAERDHFRREAARHEGRINHMLAASPVALVETDAQGRFVFANAAAHELLGRKDKEMLGLGFHAATWGIAYPDGKDIPQDLLPIARALRGQPVKTFQHQIAHHRSKQRILIAVTAFPIKDEREQITGAIASMVPAEYVGG